MRTVRYAALCLLFCGSFLQAQFIGGSNSKLRIGSITPARVEEKKQTIIYINGDHLDNVNGCTVQPVSGPEVTNSTPTKFDGCTAKKIASKKQLLLIIDGASLPLPGAYVIELTDKVIASGSDTGKTAYNDAQILGLGRFYVFAKPGTSTPNGGTNAPSPNGGTLHPYTDCISQTDASNPVSAQTASPTSVLCGSSIVPDTEVSDEFGYHVSNLYTAIQVRVSNKNPQYDFLLRDIVLTLPDGRVTSGRIRRFAQGVAVKGKTHDRRSIAFNSLTAMGGVYGALASFGSAGFTTAGNVLQGAFMSSFNQIFPDYTADNVNRFNNSVFDDQNPSIVPKDSIGQPPLYVIALVPKEPGTSKDEAYENAKNIQVSIEGTFIKQVTLLSLSTTSLQFAPEFISPPLFAENHFNFSAQQTAKEDVKEFTISNTGSTAMNVHDFKIVPSGNAPPKGASDFQIETAASNCGISGDNKTASDGSSAFSVLPKTSCILAIRFHPTRPGPISATLKIDGDDLEGPTAVTLTGTGVGLIMRATDKIDMSKQYFLNCSYSSLTSCEFPIGNQKNASASIDVYYFSNSTPADKLTVSQVPSSGSTADIDSQVFNATLTALPSAKPLTVPFPTGDSTTTMSFSNSGELKAVPLKVIFKFETLGTETEFDPDDQTSSFTSSRQLKPESKVRIHVKSSIPLGTGILTEKVTVLFMDSKGAQAGIVLLDLDATTGIATLDAKHMPALAAGNYTMKASFDGADKFQSSLAKDTPQITIPPPAPTPVTLTISDAPSGAAVNRPLDISVSATPGSCTGTVTAAVAYGTGHAPIVPDISPKGVSSGPWKITFTPPASGRFTVTVTDTPADATVCSQPTQTGDVTIP